MIRLKIGFCSILLDVLLKLKDVQIRAEAVTFSVFFVLLMMLRAGLPEPKDKEIRALDGRQI